MMISAEILASFLKLILKPIIMVQYHADFGIKQKVDKIVILFHYFGHFCWYYWDSRVCHISLPKLLPFKTLRQSLLEVDLILLFLVLYVIYTHACLSIPKIIHVHSLVIDFIPLSWPAFSFKSHSA